MEEKNTISEHPITDIDVAKKFFCTYNSAERRGKEFNLSLNDVRRLLKTKKCYYTKIELSSEEGDNKLTFDRVNNNKGYIKDNVVACCHLANQIKNELLEKPTSDIKTNLRFMTNLINKLNEVQ